MSEEIEYPSKERERAKVNVKVSAEVNTYLHDLYNQIQYEFCEQYEDEIKDLQKEKDGLNNIINELEKWIEDNLGNCRTNQNYSSNQIYNLKEDSYYRCLNKLKELKEAVYGKRD